MIAKANLKSGRAMALIDAPVGYTVQQVINARGGLNMVELKARLYDIGEELEALRREREELIKSR